MSALNVADRLAALGWLGAWFGMVALYMRWASRRVPRDAHEGTRRLLDELERRERR